MSAGLNLIAMQKPATLEIKLLCVKTTPFQRNIRPIIVEMRQ
jgi:hypothetical protein